jgi:hypothetical protein
MMLGAKASGEMTMLPRVIELVVGIVWPSLMAYSVAVLVDMGRIGVPRLIAVMWRGLFARRGGRGLMVRCGPMCRRRVTATIMRRTASWV